MSKTASKDQAKLSIEVFTQSGESAGQIDLNPKVFGKNEVSSDLMFQTVNAQLSNRRRVIAHTKNRGEVRGGGKKPWKQKGTGRARAGSIRSPLWRGGGVTFGPTNARNFSKHITKKAKRQSLFGALSERLKSKCLWVIVKFEIGDAKTKSAEKQLSQLRKTLKLNPGKILLILAKPNQSAFRSMRNLPKVVVLTAENLNIVDVLASANILITKEALPIIEKAYLKGK